MYRYLLLTLILTSQAFAAGPDQVNYQAYLQNSDGTALNGTVNLQFEVWNDPVSTNNNDLLYNEDHPAVDVINGLFNAKLGGGTVLLGIFGPNLFTESNRWLQIIVEGEALTPRTKFLSVPYALQARQADSISGLSGAVMHFALPQCPPGWSEFIDARGRTLVGLPASGTLQGTSGTPLNNLESRQHTHSVSTPSVSSATVSSHGHSVAARTTSTDTHNHRWSRWNGTLRDWTSYNSSGGSFTITNWTDGMDQAGSGIYPIAASSTGTTTIYTDNDAHNHSLSSFSTGSGGAHNHTVPGTSQTSSNANSSDTLPYMQLLVCVKN